MLDIIKFYFNIISKVLTDVMGKWELVPGVSFFHFALVVVFVGFIIGLFYHKYRDNFYDDRGGKK